MSEQGWRDFLGVEGFDDWVVLHGGATAVFRVASLVEAARVTVAVAREHVATRLAAAIDTGGRIVDDTHAPKWWTLSDRAGNRVCVCGWPDGSAGVG